MNDKLVPLVEYKLKAEIYMGDGVEAQLFRKLGLVHNIERMRSFRSFRLLRKRLFNESLVTRKKRSLSMAAWILQLYNLLKKMMVERPNFTRRHVTLTERKYWRYDLSEHILFLNMTDTFWSFLKQYQGMQDKYIDDLFSETEENKRQREKELKELYDKSIKILMEDRGDQDD